MELPAGLPTVVPKRELDVYVLPDGGVVPADAVLLVRSAQREAIAPKDLVDLALGFLAVGSKAVSFVWTGDRAGVPYWIVNIEKAVFGKRTTARLRANGIDELPFSLTPRELDVVSLMIAGLSNAAIASALTVSPRTVTTHVDHIMRKLDAANRSAAATVALDAGIIAVPLAADALEFQTLRIGRVVRAAGTRSLPVPQSSTSGPTTPILIGSMVPLEGRAREDGVEMIRGASLAIDEINDRGGIHGHPLQLVVQNVDVERTGLANVTQAMRSLLGSGVHAVTSGYLRHQGQAVEMAAAEGVPFLHASASSYIDDVVSANPDRFRGIFQVCPNDRNYAPSFVDFMTRLRDSGQWTPKSRDLVIAQQSAWEIIDFGIERASRMAREFGWNLIPLEVTDREGSEQAWTDLPAMIGSPAAVMLGSFFVNDHLRFLDSFLTAPSPSLIYSIYAPSLPEFRRRVGARADGLLWASTTGTYSDEIAHQFVEAYTSKFAALPGRSMAGISYDRIQILAQAWNQVSDPRDFQEVSSSLLRTRFRGVNGPYVFAGSGHGTLPLGATSSDPSIAQAHTIFQLQRGENVLLDPALYARGQFVPPAWVAPR